MRAATIVPLPGPSTAACAGADAVWCAAGSRLLAFDERGACRLEVAAPAPITGLALAGSSLVAVLEGIRLAWMDPASGRVTAERGFSGPISLAVGPVAWLLDGDRGLALPLSGEGGLGAPHAIGAAARAVGDARRLWWVGNDDHRLHTVGGTIELDAALDGTGGLALCANSVWLSTARGLCRVNAWNGERGLTVDAPGPLPHLACVDGVLIGAGTKRLVVLDPAADVEVRTVPVDNGDAISTLTGCGRTAWLFGAERAEARLHRF